MPVQKIKKGVKTTFTIAQRIKQLISALITTILAIINPVVAFIVLILAIISTATIVTNLDNFITMTDTWTLVPISDVQIIVVPQENLLDAAPACAVGFEAIPHGSVTVRTCNTVRDDEGNEREECSNEIRRLKFFGRNRICVKESGIPARKRRCAQHPVNCAKDACQPEGVDCPINDIVWLPAGQDPDFSFASYVEQTPGRNYFNLSTEVTDNNDRVHFTNTADLFPIVSLSVTRGVSRYREEMHQRTNIMQMLQEQFPPLESNQEYQNIPDRLILTQLREVPFECSSRPTETTRDEAVNKAGQITIILILTVFILVVSVIAFVVLSIGIPLLLTLSGKFCVVWCPGRMERIFREYAYTYFTLVHHEPHKLDEIHNLKKERAAVQRHNLTHKNNKKPVPPIPDHLREAYDQVIAYENAAARRKFRIICPILGSVLSLIIDTTKFILTIVVVVISWQVRNFFASIYSDECAKASEPGEESVKFVRDHVESKSSIMTIAMTLLTVLGISLAIVSLLKDGLLTLLSLRKETKKKNKISELAKNNQELSELKL